MTETQRVWCSYVDGEFIGTGDDARQILITTEEYATWQETGHVEVTDQVADEVGQLRKAACGLGCRCAASFTVGESFAGCAESICAHCERRIVLKNDRWVDPEASGDDSLWRETCDRHDTRIAEHEPTTKEG